MEMQTCAILLIIAMLYFGAVVPAYAIFLRVAAYNCPEEKRNRPAGIKSAWNSLPSSNLLSFYKSLALVLAMEFGVTIVIFMLTLAHFPVYHHDDVAQLFVKYLG
ncbi:uncharacterized protein N7477_000028 [Penicillium maclennaniae]|uniref:uncharacterized protein n=1 Tax=Penicillium maclennaniae TaxID=1343394 RepID=UPI002540CCF4|nr:uncharacterized protein N7477_000028 [Penicillium maclennaniae]KAJ5683683.1 hypothetical protein N7477_000028 [Penicillium maclennaniae]